MGQPLDKYFYGERSELTSPFLSNIYLAEDRILGFEVLVSHPPYGTGRCPWVAKPPLTSSCRGHVWCAGQGGL